MPKIVAPFSRLLVFIDAYTEVLCPKVLHGIMVELCDRKLHLFGCYLVGLPGCRVHICCVGSPLCSGITYVHLARYLVLT